MYRHSYACKDSLLPWNLSTRLPTGLGLAAVGLLFEYLAMLRNEGPQEWVYKELADIGGMKLRFLEEEDAMDYVTSVAGSLLFVRPEHVLLTDYLYEQWKPGLVRL